MTVDQSAPFEQHYFEHVYRAAYDQRNPRYKHRSYLREVRRVAPEGGALLDVGCAYGSFLGEAAGHYSCTGCDVSGHAVEVASRRLPGRAGLPVRRPGGARLPATTTWSPVSTSSSTFRTLTPRWRTCARS